MSAAGSLLSAVVVLTAAGVALLVMLIRSDRENQALRRENTQLLRDLDGQEALHQRRAWEDGQRIDSLRRALNEANDYSLHFRDWEQDHRNDRNGQRGGAS